MRTMSTELAYEVRYLKKQNKKLDCHSFTQILTSTYHISSTGIATIEEIHE